MEEKNQNYEISYKMTHFLINLFALRFPGGALLPFGILSQISFCGEIQEEFTTTPLPSQFKSTKVVMLLIEDLAAINRYRCLIPPHHFPVVNKGK